MNADDLINGRNGIAVAALLAAVGLGFTSAQTPTMAASTGMSEIAMLATKGGLDAVDAMLDARSPGLRTPGALTQTKGRRVASLKDAFGPKERVLGEGRTRPTPDGAAPALAYEQGAVPGQELYTPGAPTALPEGDVFVADGDPLPPAVGVYPGYGGGTPPIVVSGGGGGGSGGGSGGDGGGSNPPAAGPAVPEPATWLSLLMGFFAIGAGLRGRATRRPVRHLSGPAVR